ncbi:STAS domain-containing protein [Aquisphaera insulae]|uniref:STAS domain-containing protein n=1 Tax=Aquisphaera insulae TaxID=2712864 RepID=UPI0013EA9DCE|nr:STAS domain-containing protein [Aquisphaera insulae]
MSAPTLKHMKLEDVNGVAVVDFVDSSLMFESGLVQEVGDELVSILTDHAKHRLLLDFKNVQYVSSTMLAQLARLAKDVQKLKGQLKITGLGPILKDTFRISHLESLFMIYDDRDSALSAFRP